MALALFDRVQETTTTSGTGAVTLGGAVSGFQSFAVVGNGNTCYYTILDGTAWEVGIGTYSTTGPSLARTTVLSNSSGTTSPLTLSAGAKNVFLTYPAEKSVNLDASGNVSPLGTVSSGVWQGSTVGVAYGGTGVNTSSGANSVMLRDANQNVSINRLNQGSTTITAAAGTTTLTAASTFSQILVGTGNQTFKLPDATTLTATTAFQFNNNATGTLTIVDNASATVGTITSGGAADIALLANGTVAGTWDVHAYIPENVTWGTNSLYLSTTVITGGTWNGGVISTAYGGTGLSGATPFTSGGALYATSTSALTSGTLPASAGGTGVNNGSSTITLAGSVTHAGAFTQTFTATGNTSVTLPTSGYLLSSVTQLGSNPITGTPSSSNYLRGDGTWAAVPSSMVYPSSTGLAYYNGSAWGTSYGTTGSGTTVALATSPTISTSAIINGTGSSNTGILQINASDTSSSFVWASQTFNSGMTSGQHLIHMFGKAGSTKNAGYIGFKYAGGSSDSNVITFGLYGADDLVTISGTGALGVTGYIDNTGVYYARSNYQVLNSAANGWITVIDRNGGSPFISNISSLTSSSITMNGTASASATLGGIAASWAGNSSYPTLYGSSTDRWVMHINPHISYTQSGVNGYTGSMTGSTVRMASDTSATTYWDIGVGTSGVGTDRFSIGRAGTTLFNINSGGVTRIGGTSIYPGWGTLFATGGVGAASGNKLLYFYNDGSTIKVDAYDYGTLAALNFNIGGNGGTVSFPSQVTNFGNSASDSGISLFYGAGGSDYARIRCYQAGANNQTIHVFSTAWQGGTLYNASSGAFNIQGVNGTTFGVWNSPSVVINSGTTGPRMSVVTTTGVAGSIGDWSTAHAVFGPNALNTRGAALALSYNTTSDYSEIISLSPSIAWKQLRIFSAGLGFYTSYGGYAGAFDSSSNFTVEGGLYPNGSVPLTFQYGGNTGTYNRTVIYANQNNTGGDVYNGIFIERGRMSDNASAEVRYFSVGARGGQYQFLVNGVGGIATGGATPGGFFGGNAASKFYNGSGNIEVLLSAGSGGAFIEFDQSSGSDWHIAGNTNSNLYVTQTSVADRMYFNGSNGVVYVPGTLSKGGGSFDIPHPTKPGFHLRHSFVEGPRVDLIYRGHATLVDGMVVLNMDTDAVSEGGQTMTPGTFEALTRDADIFVQNKTGWEPVRGSLEGATLTIVCKDLTSTDTVSWMVVAERKDAFLHEVNTTMTDEQGRMILEYEYEHPVSDGATRPLRTKVDIYEGL